MNTVSHIRSVALAALLAAAGLPVAAQTRPQPGLGDQQATELEEVVVIGRSNPVTTVERAERNQARQVRDLFTGDPSIDLAGGTRNGQRLFLRGIESSNLNVTIDGARQGQNLYNHRGGLSNIDPEILKRVEIQPGPAAADQGYGALGGSVRFETVDAQDRLLPGQAFGGFARVGYASAQDAQRLGLGLYGRLSDTIGALLYVSGTDFDDLRIGGGDRVPFSGGEDRSLLAKLSVIDVGPHSLRLGYEHNDATGLNFMQRGDYPWQLQPIDPRTRPPQDQSLTRDTATVRYGFDPSDRRIDLRIDLYASRNDFYAPNSSGERFISDVSGGDIRNITNWVLLGGRAETTFGLDYVRDEGTASRADAGTRYTETDNLGLFVQQRLYLDQAVLYAGVRRDDFSADYGPRTSSGDALSFNAGGEFEVIEGVTLFAGYGEASRGSGNVPIQFARNAAPGLTFNGSANGDLRPETSRQWEGGGRLIVPNVGPWDGTFRAQATVFRTEIRDAVLFAQPGTGGLGGRPITDLFNQATDVVYEGFEAGLEYGWAVFDTAVRYSGVDVDGLPEQPQFVVRAGAPRGDQWVWDSRWRPRSDLSLGYTLRHVQDLTEVPSVAPANVVYIAKDGYTLHDIQAVWRPRGLRGAAIELAVTNLTDERYVAHSTLTQNGLATQDPGRDVRLGLSWRY